MYVSVSYTHLDVYKRQGLLSSFAGRGAVRKIFGSPKDGTAVTLNEVRTALKSSAQNMVDGQKSGKELERLVNEQIGTGFAAIKERLETETENVLKDTEQTLADIRETFIRKNMESEQIKQELKELTDKTESVARHVKEVDEQINAVLLA